MKKLIVSLLCCLSAYAMAQRPQPTTKDSIISTEVLPGNKVVFRIYAPEAGRVNLRSDEKWGKIDF